MTPHPPGEDFSEEGARKPSQKPSFIPFLGVSRTRMMGSRGLGAASIGWTLAGCVLVGFGAGAWLDKKLGTTYWMPVLFLVGVAAGFVEMFRTLAQINKAPRDSFSQGSATHATPSPRAASPTASFEPKFKLSTGNEEEVAETPRQRLFAVPPPPFMEQGGAQGKVRELDSKEITRRLLGVEDDKDEEAQGEEKSDAV